MKEDHDSSLVSFFVLLIDVQCSLSEHAAAAAVISSMLVLTSYVDYAS